MSRIQNIFLKKCELNLAKSHHFLSAKAKANVEGCIYNFDQNFYYVEVNVCYHAV